MKFLNNFNHSQIKNLQSQQAVVPPLCTFMRVIKHPSQIRDGDIAVHVQDTDSDDTPVGDPYVVVTKVN